MDSVLSHRCRTWWPPHSNSLDGELSDSGPPSQNTNTCHELDLASLMHECFVPLDDLVPCHVDIPVSAACVQASHHVGQHGMSEGNKPFNNEEDDTKDTLHLVSSVLKMYCGDQTAAMEFFLGLQKIGIHLDLSDDIILNTLEKERKHIKNKYGISLKSKRFQKALVRGSTHVARALSAGRYHEAAGNAERLLMTVQSMTEARDSQDNPDMTSYDAGKERLDRSCLMLHRQPGDLERSMMRAHYLARCAANEASSAAAARGEEKAANIHANIAKYHGRAIHRCRQAASCEAYYENNSAILNVYKLDLHGLHVTDAIEVLEYHINYLCCLNNPCSWLMKVVTGVGNHSASGIARIQPAVLDYLAVSGYFFDVEDMNPGIVRIMLERRDRNAMLGVMAFNS